MGGNLFFKRGKRHIHTSSKRSGNSVVGFDKWKRNIDRIPKEILAKLYREDRKSMQEIAVVRRCSLHKVAYWMEKYKICRRKRSEAMYVKYNPGGDPFVLVMPQNIQEAKLFGLGLGL